MRNCVRRDLQDLPREQHLPDPPAYPVANYAPCSFRVHPGANYRWSGLQLGGGGGGGGFQMDCGPCVFVGPYRYCEARDPPVLALTFDDGPTDTTAVRPPSPPASHGLDYELHPELNHRSRICVLIANGIIDYFEVPESMF